MSLQTMRLNRPILTPRLATAANTLNLSMRTLRRSENALLDAMQAWVRTGHGLMMLIGIDHPGPSFAYDLPALYADAPLVSTPYGLIAQLLTTVSKLPDARAAVRASAHSLSLVLPRSFNDGFRSSTNDSSSPPRAVAHIVERLAGDAPLVIQLDHLHRADAPSLKLLREAAAELENKPILIVGTYRADQAYPADLGALLTPRSSMSASFAPIWTNDLTVLLDDLFGRKTPLSTMIESAKNNDRLLLLGGVPLLEACRRYGRWTDGLTLSERVITLAQSTDADYVLAAARVIRSQILLGLGQWAEAQAECDQVITSKACATDRNLTAAAVWGGYKARSMMNLPARNLMEALRRWRMHARTSDDPSSVAPIVADMIVHLAETDQLNEARTWQRDLEALVEYSGHPAARLADAIGQGALSARAADWLSAIGAYRAAVQHASTLHDLLLEARANGGLALSLLELGDNESKNEGRERLSVAHSVLSRLNAKPDVEHCEAGAKQFGLRPRQRRPSAANRTPGSLTRREREVLALVVNGLTNRQIAQRLTISEKTAEGHVGNILAKLSCSSRIKAAELARATGLLEGSPA